MLSEPGRVHGDPTGTYRKLAGWPQIQAAIWLCPNSSMEVDREGA